jgi:hypothetical protein
MDQPGTAIKQGFLQLESKKDPSGWKRQYFVYVFHPLLVRRSRLALVPRGT